MKKPYPKQAKETNTESPKEIEVIERIGNTSNASVIKATQKSWRQWVNILNKAGGEHWTHQELVALLTKKYKLRPWWQQLVANRYAVFINKRVEGQTLAGDYTLTVTKSLDKDAATVWKALQSPQGIEAWLNPLSPIRLRTGVEYEIYGGIYGLIKKVAPPRQLRFTWQEDRLGKSSTVELLIVAKKGPKSILVITQNKIPSSKLKAELRAYWKMRVMAFCSLLGM